MKQKATLLLILALSLVLISCTTEESPNVTITGAGEETEEPEAGVATGEETGEETTEDEDTDDLTEVGVEKEIETGKQEVIVMKDIGYHPTKLTIEKGTTIMWIHDDMYAGNENIVHNVRVYSQSARSSFEAIKSNKMLYGSTFNLTMDIPGEYYFMDIIHSSSMRGTIIVTG